MTAPLLLNLLLSLWLLASAWLLPYGTAGAWNAILVALLALAVSLLAWSAPGRPGLHHATSVLAVWLVASTMLLPHASLAAMANSVLVAMGLAAVALLFPAHRKRGVHPAPRAT